MTNHMKRNSQKKRNIRRSSLKQKKKVQHGGKHTFKYNELIGKDAMYGYNYFVELLDKIIDKPNKVYNLLTLNNSISLEQFQNVLKTYFLTPIKIERTTKLRIFRFYLDSKTVAGFKDNTKITTISGLQMAILYGRYELIEQLFYYKLPDKKHSVITPDMYDSFYKNINVIIDTTPNVATSQPEEVANSNALHLVFTCGVNIEDTPFIQSASEIAKLRHFSKMYLIKQLFHKINENWYKVIRETSVASANPAIETSATETPASATPADEQEYDNMKNNLLSSLIELQNAISYYKNTNAKKKLTEFISEYNKALNYEVDPKNNIKNLYNVVFHNKKEFINAITPTENVSTIKTLYSNANTFFSKAKAIINPPSIPKTEDTKSNPKQINNYYKKFFNQLKEDYLTIINHEKDNHNSKLDNSKLNNSEFIKVYENLKKKNNDFLPEIEVIKENNDEYVDFVIYKQFMWDGTKSILLPNAKDEIIKLNDTDYKLEYEGSLKTVILPGTNKINDKIISNENIEESQKINIITLNSDPTVTFHEEFIITPIDIPEKSASSEIVPDTSDVVPKDASNTTVVVSQEGSDVKGESKEESKEA